MTDSMVERVARALFEKQQPHHAGAHVQWNNENEDWCEEDRDGFRDLARAAIAAMREPTEGMLAAGLAELLGYGEARDVWPAMIDAALKD